MQAVLTDVLHQMLEREASPLTVIATADSGLGYRDGPGMQARMIPDSQLLRKPHQLCVIQTKLESALSIHSQLMSRMH